MFKNIIHSLVTKGLVAVINFLVLIISSKYLGVSSRGEISIFVLNITIIQVINEIYTGYSLIYFIPRFDLKKLFISGIIYTLIFCSLSNTVIVFLNKQVSGYEWLGYLVSFMVIVNTFNCVLILGKEKIRAYNLLSFIQPFILLVALAFYIWVLKVFTFEAYIFPLLVSFAVALVISLYNVGKFITGSGSKTFELKPLLVNGAISQAGILMYIFCNRYSYYILPDRAEVGLYASASSLMEAVLIIGNAISPVLAARLANSGNTKDNTGIAISLSKVAFVFSLLAVAVVFLLPDRFFIYMLGHGFAGIKNIMLLYSPGVLMISCFTIISYYFSALGKQKLVLLCNACGFIFTLFAAPVLIGRYGIQGAAYTANIAYFIIATAMLSAFFVSNKLSARLLWSFKRDYTNLKALVLFKQG